MITENKRPLILITNDDGDHAPGIETLTKLMMQLGDVVVMAPDGPRSGQSNALTITHPISFKLLEKKEGLTRYSCTGTPTDCVKIALFGVLDRKPDLLVSGINHGSNSSVNVLYSGTMGAALEGAVNNILSIGFSISDHSFGADFSALEPYILKICKKALTEGLAYGVCLNVNCPTGEVKGVKTVHQCRCDWTEEYDKRTDPRGNKYYWLTGQFKNHEPNATDTDEWALANGYISIVPTQIDMTHYETLKAMQSWEF